ncbi:MAG: hypothetical protein Tp158DCM1229571_31 [Prokaryotic dsDNA virus sp.]|nr:MAG: hypothetical protein Tp158DCM1229571_31 [Prokaryotic dsDNA virus sp.]|tara:strand:- start:56317 stop:56925 length:609 start_codon:yes stop_codon:yes gene_type:complete
MKGDTRYLSNPDIAYYARKAGFSGDLVPVMVAIANAESGRDRLALNPNAATGDESYGLTQINMIGAMGPERRKLFGIKSNEELYDPETNLKAAKKIYDRQGLNAWSVFRSGAYKPFLDSSIQASNLDGGIDRTELELGKYEIDAGKEVALESQNKREEAMKSALMFKMIQNQLQQPSMIEQLIEEPLSMPNMGGLMPPDMPV